MKAPPTAFDFEIPRESVLLKAAYRKAGLTVADLAAATGLSVGTVSIALNGVRYREGQGRPAVPPDRTLVRLSSVLGIHPDVLRAHDRARAAELLAEAIAEGQRPAVSSEVNAQAAVAARAVLVRQVLAVFSTDELHSELERREREYNEALDQEVWHDAAADLRADLGVP